MEELKEKPPTLNEEQVWGYARQNLDSASRLVQLGTHTHREVQRDADIKWFKDWLKQEVGKMEVIGDEKMDKAYCLADLHEDTLGHEAVAQAQLQADKDRLLTMME